MQKYRRLFQYAWRRRPLFVFILILTLAASLLAALQPWPMKLLVDQVLGHQPMPTWLQGAMKALGLQPTPSVVLGLVALGGLVLFALSSALEIGLTWLWTMAGRRMVYDLTEDLFARLQRRSLPFHSRNPVGDSMSRITVDSWCVYQVIDALVFAPFHAALTMTGMV